MGLIAGGQFQSPLKEGANIINGSTHKTLAGPYAGLIVTRDHPEQSHIAWRVMNGVRLFEVNYKPATIAAMGVAMEEYRDFGAEYVQAVIENGRRLGQVLAQHRGLHASEAPNGEYTNSHQVHVVLGPKEEAERISQVLEEANIDVNPTRIPFSAGQYGLRIGMAGVTRLGMEPETIMKIGHLIADVIEGKRAIIDIRNEVIQIAQTHEVVKYTHSTPDEDQLGFAERAP